MTDKQANNATSPSLLGRLFPSRLRRRLPFIVAGSGIFLLLKIALVWMANRWGNLPAWLVYAIVSIAITPLGWLYHSKVSFGVDCSKITFAKYSLQAALFKVADYSIYIALVYLLDEDVVYAVPISGAILYIVRILVYFRLVFTQDEKVLVGGTREPPRSRE